MSHCESIAQLKKKKDYGNDTIMYPKRQLTKTTTDNWCLSTYTVKSYLFGENLSLVLLSFCWFICIILSPGCQLSPSVVAELAECVVHWSVVTRAFKLSLPTPGCKANRITIHEWICGRAATAIQTWAWTAMIKNKNHMSLLVFVG